jgi:hypothetical protein
LAGLLFIKIIFDFVIINAFTRPTSSSLQKIFNELPELSRTTRKKYFDYFIDYIRVNYSLPRLGARRRTLAQTIGNARGLDINSPLSAGAHTQDL